MYKKWFEEKKHVNLLLLEERGKRLYALITDLNTFIYDCALHRGKKYFCRYCLQSFSTDKILKTHVKVCFKVIGKQMVKIPKKGDYARFKNNERKIKSSFMIIYENQNLDEFYTTKYQKHVAFSYGYKLVCADEKLVILLSHT